VAEESVTEAPRNDDAEEVTRKRGRPPKRAKTLAENDDDDETERLVVAKKPRGRPRKQVVDADAPSETPSEAPSKRPRGRPKKSDVVGDDAEDPENGSASAARSPRDATTRAELNNLRDFLGSGKKETEPVLRRGTRRRTATSKD